MLAEQADRLSALFEAHADRLYRLVRRLVPVADDALDLVQETFLIAMCPLPRRVRCGRSVVGLELRVRYDLVALAPQQRPIAIGHESGTVRWTSLLRSGGPPRDRARERRGGRIARLPPLALMKSDTAGSITSSLIS
jgi:hypothetical protein